METEINKDKVHYDVLVVEDEEVVRLSVVRILDAENITVDIALDAEMAIEKFSNNIYKLVITDLMLPGISGMELIKKLKDMKYEIPIIMITGYATLENAIKSIQNGAYDFLPKPFSYEELAGIATRAIKVSEEPGKFNLPELRKNNKFNENIKKVYYMGLHSWVKIFADNSIFVGAGVSFQGTIGEIEKINLPELGSDIYQGNSMVQIVAKNGFAHTIWSPLSGRVMGRNDGILKNPKILTDSPLMDGWLLKIIPTNYDDEIQNLSEEKDF